MFSAEGIAVAPGGDIYFDTAGGNGFSPDTALTEIPVDGTVQVLAMKGSAVGTLPAVGVPRFPTGLYSAATPAVDGAGIESCPGPTGVQSFDTSARAAAVTEAGYLNGEGFYADLALSDRSWWAGVYDSYVDTSYD
ncbi:MAG TPA: hypothetical protein VFW71_06425 [Actinomycetota bacterium]|nr:hypothetical protein [Actinomycetota bacterium]